MRIPGPTLADQEGEKRIRWIEKSCANVQFQILERQRNALIMAQEAERIREGA